MGQILVANSRSDLYLTLLFNILFTKVNLGICLMQFEWLLYCFLICQNSLTGQCESSPERIDKLIIMPNAQEVSYLDNILA